MEIEKVCNFEKNYWVNDNLLVPKTPNNSHFKAVQKWIAEGGTVELFDYSAEALADKITQIKSTAATLILETYPTHKQLNVLMSGDATLIEAMNLFILEIRNVSNALESELQLLTELEDIKNFSIQF